MDFYISKEHQSDKFPLVSVIVPNYNYARYLPQRINSVLQQTFTDFELILLDDASTDDSETVLKDYYNKYENISKLIINQTNTGSPFKQWMKGIEQAKGKYIWIAEADDVSDVRFLETCISIAEQYKDTAICNVGSRIIDENGNINPKDINHFGKKRIRKGSAYFNGHQYVEHNLYWKNYTINASGILFRREYAINLKDSSFLKMRYCGDWLFWVEMALQGGVIEVYQNLNYFRQHTQKVTTASRNVGGGVQEDIHVLHQINNYLPNIPRYKKRLRNGLLYRKIKRLSIEDEKKTILYKELFGTLNSSILDYYLERMNQVLRIFIPTLTTRKRDRLS